MKARIWEEGQDDYGTTFNDVEIPDDLRDEASLAREQMLETLADYNEEIMQKFLEGEAVESELISRAIRQATLSNKLIPMLFGSALRNKGIQLFWMLLSIIFLSTDIPPIGESTPDQSEESVKQSPIPLPLAFKIASDPHGNDIFPGLFRSDTIW